MDGSKRLIIGVSGLTSPFSFLLDCFTALVPFPHPHKNVHTVTNRSGSRQDPLKLLRLGLLCPLKAPVCTSFSSLINVLQNKSVAIFPSLTWTHLKSKFNICNIFCYPVLSPLVVKMEEKWHKVREQMQKWRWEAGKGATEAFSNHALVRLKERKPKERRLPNKVYFWLSF